MPEAQGFGSARRVLRVDQVHVIRHKVLVEGRSARQVAKELGISRRTVRKYLTEAVPIRTETQPRLRPVWDAVRMRVEQGLAESAQWTGGKQRLPATRLHELLVAEGHRVGVTLIKEAVAEWKRQRREVFVPLTYRPGDLAEVDFFEVLVDVEVKDVRHLTNIIAALRATPQISSVDRARG